MYTLSIENFCNSKSLNISSGIYIVRKKKEILYVGISQNILDRWFGLRGRMIKNIYDEWVSYDAISNEIIKNMPKSLGWNIDLWSIEEGSRFFDNPTTELREIETEFIVVLEPKINYIGNTINEYSNNKVKQYFDYIKNNKEKIIHIAKNRSNKCQSLFITDIPQDDDIPF